MTALSSAYEKAFSGFPSNDMYRLFIDKKDQEHGPKYYDIKEPGYYSAMMKAFAFVHETLGQPIDADFLCRLHDIGVDGVQTMGYTPGSYGAYTTPKLMIKGFYPEADYQLNINDISKEAKEELQEEKLLFFILEKEIYETDEDFEEAFKGKPEEDLYPNNLKNRNFGCTKVPGLNDWKSVNISNIDRLPIVQSRELSYQPKSDFSSCLGIESGYLATCRYDKTALHKARVHSNFKKDSELEKVKEKINFFCRRYYQELKNPLKDYTKLAAELAIDVNLCNKLAAKNRLCRCLEIFHVFGDGNQRLYAFSLSLKLAIENDYSPSILENPNIFDGYCSLEQLIRHDVQGMKNFQALKTKDKDGI